MTVVLLVFLKVQKKSGFKQNRPNDPPALVAAKVFRADPSKVIRRLWSPEIRQVWNGAPAMGLAHERDPRNGSLAHERDPNPLVFQLFRA